MSRPAGPDPFAALGLAARPGLTDDEVRSAWRRVATACHPDRADGGDPGRFAEAAAAYTVLRTALGRGEALADLQGSLGAAERGPLMPTPGPRARAVIQRVRQGRPARLGLRLAAVAAVIAFALLADGSGPATPALTVGALTWLVLTGRRDLAPPHHTGTGRSRWPGRQPR